MTCKHDPRNTKGPIGMYHCPECNEMVVAGLDHPDTATSLNNLAELYKSQGAGLLRRY